MSPWWLKTYFHTAEFYVIWWLQKLVQNYRSHVQYLTFAELASGLKTQNTLYYILPLPMLSSVTLALLWKRKKWKDKEHFYIWQASLFQTTVFIIDHRLSNQCFRAVCRSINSFIVFALKSYYAKFFNLSELRLHSYHVNIIAIPVDFIKIKWGSLSIQNLAHCENAINESVCCDRYCYCCA